jgi:hypothetical protein
MFGHLKRSRRWPSSSIVNVTRREVASLIFGIGLGGVLFSVAAAFEALRAMNDWKTISEGLAAVGVSYGVFLAPVILLAMGLIVLAFPKKPLRISS